VGLDYTTPVKCLVPVLCKVVRYRLSNYSFFGISVFKSQSQNSCSLHMHLRILRTESKTGFKNGIFSVAELNVINKISRVARSDTY